MLPDKVEGEGRATEWYNKTLGSSTYKEKIKPIVDKALGGSLRLFIQKVYNGRYFTRDEEVVVSTQCQSSERQYVGADERTDQEDGNLSEPV